MTPSEAFIGATVFATILALETRMRSITRLVFWVALVTCLLLMFPFRSHAFGPIPKADQCISVNALLQRNCAPVYMCNGPKDTNADWCCSTERRWLTEEQRLIRWYKRNCEK